MGAQREEGGGREIELKLAVDGPDALLAVAAAARRRGARAASPVVQENRFFDAADGRLAATGRTVRLRAAGGRFTLTAKGALEEAGDLALHVRAEEEAEVDAEIARAIRAGHADPLAALAAALGRPAPLIESLRAALGDAPLVALGAFANERTVVGPLKAGATEVALELDRTTFPGGVVTCEVELELDAAAVADGRRLLRELLSEAGVEGRPARSKAERFFALVQAARRSGA